MAQDVLQVPGTSVKMAPPPGFAPATDFAGFVNVEQQGSFVIAEMPAEAMSQLAPLFGDQQKAAASFATKGIKVDGQEEIETKSGETALLLHGTQDANGTTLDKWMALYAGEKTVMITFQIPQTECHRRVHHEDCIRISRSRRGTGRQCAALRLAVRN